MLSMLKTGNAEMRIAAAEVLKSVGTKESMPALYDAALDNDFRLASAAKEAMRKVAPDDFTPSMESVVDMESGHNTRMRAGLQRLCEAKVDKHQDRVAKLLVNMALDNDPVVREGAQKALPIWGTKDTVTTFIDLLGDRSEQGRRQLAHAALGALKDPRGAAAVARWAGTDIPFAMNALHEMGPVAEDAVIDLLTHERSDIRIAAVRILKTWGTRNKAIPALTAALQRDRATIEMDAREAIIAIKERPVVLPPRRPAPSTQPTRSPGT
jgi:HEAT repeat protein